MTKKNLPAIAAERRAAERMERVESFQSLQSGNYWRSNVDIPQQGIDKNTVLLIQSIRYVDDAPHTIILRSHPSLMGQSYEVEKDNGYTQYVRYGEHRFLLTEFLQSFEYEPDHETVRRKELAAIQSQITQLQNELIESQHSPKLLAAYIEVELEAAANREAAEATEEGRPAPTTTAVALPADLARMATGSVASAIDAGINESSIAQIKAAAHREHQIATIKAKWITNKTKEISETISAMTPFYQEQAAAALARTEDVRSYVDKLMKGIQSLDLYVGKGVEVHTIHKGASAPVDEPLTFMQRKLLMDEEFCLWADVDANFDFTREESFFEALIAEPGLRDQIFPTPRCVLVMAATRRSVEYGDTWSNLQRNLKNKEVFLLVRDGENLFKVHSPVESHMGAACLFPSQGEQDQIFRGFNGREIKFEDVAFTDALDQHEQHALHYKRFLLLACGLDHRLKLFGEFYPGPASMHFVSLEFQENYCRFLHDDGSDGRLLGGSRPPLRQWLMEKNAFLRSGARVLCNWREAMNPETAPAASRAREKYGYERRYTPENPVDMCIAYREGTSFCVDIEVSGEFRRRSDTRSFTAKVNLSKIQNSRWENEQLPYLCLDTVDPADVRWYIYSRESRVEHLSYIRFFKRALKFLEADRAVEAESRATLKKALEDGRIAEGASAEAIVDQAVSAWRAANRGAALPLVSEGQNTPVWKSLLDQMFSLAGAGRAAIADVEAFLKEKGHTPLRLVLDGQARMKVYATPADHERDDRLTAHRWVHLISFEPNKAKLKERSRRWTLLPPNAASETTLHEWAESKAWAAEKVHFGTLDRKQKCFEETTKFEERLAHWTRSLTEVEFESAIERWSQVRAHYVRNPQVAIPIGLVHYGEYGTTYLCVGLQHPEGLLGSKAPAPALANKLRALYARRYAEKGAASERFDLYVKGMQWDLMEVSLRTEFSDFCYVPGESGRIASGNSPCDPRLGPWLEGFQKEVQKRAKVWVNPSIFDDFGKCVLDDLLGIQLPEGFEPVRIHHVELHGKKLPTYDEWFDIVRLSEETEETEVRRESIPDGFGSSSSSYTEETPAAARELLAQLGSKDGKRVVNAKDWPDAPAPPEGVERWYVVPKA